MASANSSAKQQEILGDAEFNKKWEAESQYTYLRKSNDPRFGEISLYKGKNSNDFIFAKEKMVTSKQQASNDIRDLKSRIGLNHQNLHKLTGYSTQIQKELCSTNYLTKAYYEFPKSELQKEINDRRQSGNQFSGDELTNIAQQSINGLNHLHNLDISHGDVRPLYIGYSKDNRGVQILDRLQDPSPLERLQSNNIINKKDLYISPEVYRKLQGKDKTLKYNPYKNDLYGLGLSLLAAGNLDSVQNIYKPNGDVDQVALNNHLTNFDDKYAGSHPQLSNIVHTLVHQDEGSRWTSKQFSDAFANGSFASGAASNQKKVFAEPPSLFDGMETTTTTTTYQYQPAVESVTKNYVQSAPAPVVINETIVSSQASAPVEKREETTIVYSTDDSSNAKIGYENPTYTYSNLVQPQVKYVSSAPTTTYVSSAPTTTYVNSAPTTTYVSSAPTTTYVNSAPTTTYVSSVPTNTYTTYSSNNAYVNSAPTTTYVQSEPTTTYVNANPTTYVQSNPQIVSYSSPTEYVQMAPTTTYTTYSSAPSDVVVQPTTAISSGTNLNFVGKTTVTVKRADGTTYSYDLDNGKSPDDIMHTYEEHDPLKDGEVKRTKNSYTTYAAPAETTTTLVNAPQTTQTYTSYSTPATQTYTTYMTPGTQTYSVESGQTYTVSPSTQSYQVQGAPVYTTTKVYSTPSDGVTYSYPNTYRGGSIFVNSSPDTVIRQGETVSYQPVTYTKPDATVSYTTAINPTQASNVEVRRGSSIPIAAQDQSVKKKYIIEGDKVIEVDDNDN